MSIMKQDKSTQRNPKKKIYNFNSSNIQGKNKPNKLKTIGNWRKNDI